MSIDVAKAIEFAKRRVLDTPSGYRYADSEFLDGVNQGLAAMLEQNPVLFGKPVVMPMVPGILQEISEDAEQYLEVSRNMGTDGTTPGRAVRTVPGQALTASNPNWAVEAPSAVIQHAFPSPGSRRHFFVYPPQPDPDPAEGIAPGQAEVWVALHPGEVESATGTIEGLQARHSRTLGNYAAYYVLSMDQSRPENEKLAAAFYMNFVALLQPPPTEDEG